MNQLTSKYDTCNGQARKDDLDKLSGKGDMSVDCVKLHAFTKAELLLLTTAPQSSPSLAPLLRCESGGGERGREERVRLERRGKHVP